MARTEEWDSTVDAYIIVPPLIRYSAGPLLGPALVAGAANSAGFRTKTLDLSISYMHSTGLLPPPNEGPAVYYGDHCKPGNTLNVISDIFWESIHRSATRMGVSVKKARMLSLSHEELLALAENLEDTNLGRFILGELSPLPQSPIFGVSIMWEWQVITGMFISLVVKKRWPATKVVWGGPHITAISDMIVTDKRYGRWIDAFLPFQSELSFAKLLENPERLSEIQYAIMPGQDIVAPIERNKAPLHRPTFPDLSLYGRPRLILPTELSIGCPYGRCSFCTYPAIEGEYDEFPLRQLDYTLALAKANSAAISIKDSLVTHIRLRKIAAKINGDVPWSACTKLHEQLNDDLLAFASQSGCRTLEVGLETLDPETQELIEKRQLEPWFEQLLTASAKHGVSLIVNYITGFPGEDESKAASLLKSLVGRLQSLSRTTNLQARTEHHKFRLERMSPMARNPEKYGISVNGEWPWSSVLDWQAG